MLEEFKRVVLTADLPEFGLKKGDTGIVVHIHAEGEAYEVEFFSADGETLNVITVEAHQLRATTKNEILHVRTI